MRVTQPWIDPPDEKELEAVKKAKALIERLKKKSTENSRSGFKPPSKAQ
jgi:hypothetical protein